MLSPEPLANTGISVEFDKDTTVPPAAFESNFVRITPVIGVYLLNSSICLSAFVHSDVQ